MIYRDARKTLPKPKVGDFCSIAMEQGFSDVCIPLCMGEEPVNRIVQACRHASMEMPRPTVRKWCEHGYNRGYDKTWETLQNHFTFDRRNVPEDVPEPPKAAEVPPVVEKKADEPEKVADTTDSAEEHHHLRVNGGRTVIASIPITLDEDEVILNVHDGETPEDAVVAFCKINVADEVAGCIRQLLPTVLERLDEINAAAAAAASN